jgi:hypothetical protein
VEFLYTLKAGPAGRRRRRPSSADSPLDTTIAWRMSGALTNLAAHEKPRLTLQ